MESNKSSETAAPKEQKPNLGLSKDGLRKLPNIAVDFDGVLNTYNGWKGEDELFEPRLGCEQFLQRLSQYYVVIIHSTRNFDKIRAWLEKYELIQYVHSVSETKPKAVAYIDDRALPFDGDYQRVIDTLKKGFRVHWQK